jgi:phage host-nuclease inhibitor protein Gam
MAKQRLKKPANRVPQSREEVVANIRTLGDVRRDLMRTQANMNDEIAEITQHYADEIDAARAQITELQEAIQAWCEAHRAELCPGRAKTANLTTGEVSWRQRPPSVSVRGKEAVIEALHNFGLARFIRTIEEVNKEAILADVDAVAGIAGIKITSGVEDFVIVPFEQEAKS